jgi:hypothetical protein
MITTKEMLEAVFSMQSLRGYMRKTETVGVKDEQMSKNQCWPVIASGSQW